MDLLDGDTPRQKYQSLLALWKRDVAKSQVIEIYANADMRAKYTPSILTMDEVLLIDKLLNKKQPF